MGRPVVSCAREMSEGVAGLGIRGVMSEGVIGVRHKRKLRAVRSTFG